jgi:hypothetical protein
MTDSYHYGISGPVIWISHILLGIFLAYFGYVSMKDVKLPDYVYIGVIVIGVLAVLYHTHIWITDKDE